MAGLSFVMERQEAWFDKRSACLQAAAQNVKSEAMKMPHQQSQRGKG
jgi:hypothetical protein